MSLDGKNTVVYGAAGNIGGAIARAFARAGARVFLTGPTLDKLDQVAEEIRAEGGTAETARVDAYDEQAVQAHLASIAGKLDVSVNAAWIDGSRQGTPLVEMSFEDYLAPVTAGASTHFITGRAAARRMTAQGSGVIVMLSATAARIAGPLMGGFAVACSAIEGLTRSLAGEVGPHGVRVVCLRSDAIPQTWPAEVADEPSTSLGTWAVEGENIETIMAGRTLLRRLPTLSEVANTAVFAVSDAASAMTGTVLNLSCGSVLD